jgi:RNA polymerase sigma-70 factor (ECF subfamily)
MSQSPNKKEAEQLFAEIYSKHYSELCIYAVRFLKDEDEAEEIVQEIIFKLWEQREQLENVNSLRSYLYRSVHNRCLNYIKHQLHKNKYQDKAYVEMKKLELESAEDYQQKELEDKVHAAIHSLPDRCKEVFQLSRFEGKKNKEISDHLGISVKAVEANITRALSALRESLDKYLKIELIVILTIFLKHLM